MIGPELPDDADTGLDRGLRAAFGPDAADADDSAPASLGALGERLGVRSRIMLREEADDTVHLVNPRSAELPERTPRYQVLGEIARGGFGAVLKSRDTDLGRDVAMKVLLASHADSAAMVQRFVEEAQIAGLTPARTTRSLR